jgi:hypothetical protein
MKIVPAAAKSSDFLNGYERQSKNRPQNLDKMMNGRKSGNTGGDDSDRKHLTGREVERLMEATKGSRNEARDRCLMFRHG